MRSIGRRTAVVVKQRNRQTKEICFIGTFRLRSGRKSPARLPMWGRNFAAVENRQLSSHAVAMSYPLPRPNTPWYTHPPHSALGSSCDYVIECSFQPSRHNFGAEMLGVRVLSLMANRCSQAQVTHEQQQAIGQLFRVVRGDQKSVHFMLDHFRDSAN